MLRKEGREAKRMKRGGRGKEGGGQRKKEEPEEEGKRKGNHTDERKRYMIRKDKGINEGNRIIGKEEEEKKKGNAE